MNGCDSMLYNPLVMSFGAVSLVAFKAIMGIDSMIINHLPIPGHLCDDRSCGYGYTPAVAFNQGLLRFFYRIDFHGIKEDKVNLFL